MARRPLALTALLAGIAACTSHGQVEIRPIASPGRAALNDRTGGVAAAQTQLALGNVGLALEMFRKTLREDPRSVASLAGIARSYDAIGRVDLARRYYEEALAMAPADLDLLLLLAGSLERQGRGEEARAVRSEITLRKQLGVAKVAWAVDNQPVGTITAQSPDSLTVALAPARTAEQDAPPVADRTESLQAQSTTRTTGGAASPPPAVQARIERLSLGEVALVTRSAPLWTRLPVAAPATRAGKNMLLLNAARRQGLAARTRSTLRLAGWKDVLIGDSDLPRARSLILYPLGDRARALLLARKLKVASLRLAPGNRLVVLLGRDAAHADRMRSE